MNMNHCPQSLRTRLALLLFLSTINLIAAPFLPATRAAHPAAAPLTPFDGPTEFIRQIPLVANDVVYSAATGKIYASRPSSIGSGGNSITPIDPATGVIGASTFIGSEPNKLTLSNDGNNLFVVLDGASSIRRFDLLTNTPGLQFSLGQDSFFGRYSVSDFAVAPGNPNLVAVARHYVGISPPEAGVAVFDSGVQRTNVGPGHLSGADSLAFSASPTKLYGTGPLSGFQTMTIDGSGVTVSSTSSVGNGGRIKFSNGLLFTSLGQVINPDTNSLLGTFANANTQAFVPDTAVGRAYYLTSGPASGTVTLKAFDINTFLLLGSLTIGGTLGAPTTLLRWGPNGLIFRTSSNQLFIVQTSLIPSAEPIPTPTPTPSPIASPSPTPAAAFVRQMSLSTNDLVSDQGTQKLYASVPSSEGITGNSIAEIDPVMGSISSQVFVGSEPTQLAQADDGATLYVGLDGAAQIRSYNILSHTAGAQFSLGRDNFFGPYTFSDIAVSPGNPSVVAVARQHRNVSPPGAGTAIFDNGVQRTKTQPGHLQGSDVLAFGSSSVLYGAGSSGLTTMTVDNTGITVNGSVPFASGNTMVLHNNLLYSSTGQVINPSTGALAGTFSSVAFVAAGPAIDAANGRIFFVTGIAPNIQIRAYDLNTFLPVGFVNVSGVVGNPGGLVRWGTNGLAFRTNNRQVFLIETALVDASVPVATPTPTASPTPSPTPPYIPTFIRRIDLQTNTLVYSNATQALYASVPSIAGANGNSITKIIPETGVVGPSTFIGSEPNKMALSSDGQTLWAYLDGANAARRFDLITQTAGLQFNVGPQPPSDMDVVPGSPESLAISKGGFGGGVAIYDSGVQRTNTGGFFTVFPIEFGANPSILYGSTGTDLAKFFVDASGVAPPTISGALLNAFGTGFKFSNGRLYTSSGRVVDPETEIVAGTFQGTGGSFSLAVDEANHRVFYAVSIDSTVVLVAFDSVTFVPIGSVTLPGVTGVPASLVRWGTNGLALNTQLSFFPSVPGRVYILQTELVTNSAPVPIGLQLETDTRLTFESSVTLPVKVVRTGDASGSVSVNYATSDGTATAGSDYTATSGTLTFAPGELSKTINIPITNDTLFENGSETFNLTLSSPTASAIITTPSTTTITITDDDSKPSAFISAPVRISEGDSGLTNVSLSVNLSNPSVQSITVDYTTVNNSAVAGSDYVASSGTVTVAPGTSSATFNVSINGDTTVEADEIFSITLSNATNVTFVSPFTTVVTIANDDASLQLANAAISVNESAAFATVPITRAGDVSRDVSVQYATTDTAGLQNCRLVNGKGSERCDYATTVGRLLFEAGETTKSIIIPIVNDVLVEGDETFTVTLTGPAGATLGAQSIATITIVDNDAAPATQNPLDGVEFFITQQYIDFLGRLPDSIGLANWVDTLGNCPNGGFGEFDNPNCDRVHVSAGFFLSEEFRGRGYWAYKFYEVGFDRRPTYAEFVPDMAQVGGAQSPQSEALSKAAYMDAFVQRQEFRNRYDALSNSAFLDALETNAEVTLANKAALLAALNASQKTRAQVLREIVELQSVEDKFFIRAFVAMQYFGYLRRDPDTIGYNNWVNTLTADPSNFRHMIFGFIYSDEYRHRFGP